MDELLKELTVEMLPDGLYRQIAEAIGVVGFYKLTEVVGGATVYIPKPESLIRPARDARIKAEFNGYNHPELAKKYGVTERWVRQICGEGHLEGQLDLLNPDFFGDD
jgi:Mor family transcriptional regulator